MPVPKEPQSIGQTTWLVKALFVTLGVVLMLVAMDVIPADTANVHAPPAILFAAGLAFGCIGAIGFAERRAADHPRAYPLAVALLMTSVAAIAILVTIASHDESLLVGPFVLKGPAVDIFGKLVLTLAALIQSAIAVWCWRALLRRRR